MDADDWAGMVVSPLLAVMFALNLRRVWRTPRRPDSHEVWVQLTFPVMREQFRRRLPLLEPTLNLALLTASVLIPLSIVLRQPKDPKTGLIIPAWLGFGGLVLLAGLAIACITIYWFKRPRFLIPPSLRPLRDDQMAIVATQVVPVWNEQDAEPLGAVMLQTHTGRHLLIAWWGGHAWETLPDDFSQEDVTKWPRWRALAMELPPDWKKGYLRAVGREVEFVYGKPPRRLSRPPKTQLPRASH